MSIDDIELTGSFFRGLSVPNQALFLRALEIRRRRFHEITERIAGAGTWSEEIKGRILLVGDRPGPSRPVDPGFHHTPFYSTKHCAGWLNALQITEGVEEEELVWINSTDHMGSELPVDVIERLEPWTIVLLGGNARRWFDTAPFVEDRLIEQFDHPQYWKRFRNKEPYPLFKYLSAMIWGKEAFTRHQKF